MPTVKVNGYRQAREALDGLPNGMQKSILLAARRQSARPMLTLARGKVSANSGKLKRQLRIVCTEIAADAEWLTTTDRTVRNDIQVRLSSAKLPALVLPTAHCPAANCDTSCIKPRHRFDGLL